jgi:hypothetical protein
VGGYETPGKGQLGSAIFKVTEGSVEVLKAFDDERAPRAPCLDSKTGTIYWTSDDIKTGTSLLAFDIKTKAVTTICTDCGCQGSNGAPIPVGYSGSYHFDDSSGKIVVNSDWGVLFIDPSPGVAKSSRCTQVWGMADLLLTAVMPHSLHVLLPMYYCPCILPMYYCPCILPMGFMISSTPLNLSPLLMGRRP